MKKLFLALLIAPILFLSCNKKLKKEMDELEKQLQEQKAQNATLQTQINGVASLLGSNEPMTVSTSFKYDNGITRTHSDVYSFKANNYYTQSIVDNGDGTYGIRIERFLDVDWNEAAEIEFTYISSTKAITDASISHYWDWNISGYNSSVAYSSTYSPVPTINITLNSINVSTGEIDLSASASVVDGYNGYVPNSGMACSTTLSFKGVLGKLNTTF